MIKHNNIYSQLVSEFISNSEMIVSHLSSLPNHEVVGNMSMQTASINQRFAMMNNQFKKYKEDIEAYGKYLKNTLQERKELRRKGDENNPGYKEQTELIDKLEAMQSQLYMYIQLYEKDPFVEEVKKYDKEIKSVDKANIKSDK